MQNRIEIVSALLNGNPQFYLSSNQNEIRCKIEKKLHMSTENEIDLVVARKNNLGVWMTQESPFNTALGGFFDNQEGFKGPSEDALKELNQNLSVKIDQVLMKERQRLNNDIAKNLQSLSILMEKWTKTSAQILRDSVSSKPKERVESLFSKELQFLNENIEILSKQERERFSYIQDFFIALKESSHSKEYFEKLKSFFKN